VSNITFIADGGYNSAAATSVALTKPAGVTAGNLLIAFVGAQDNNAGAGSVTVTTLAGWTRIIDSPRTAALGGNFKAILSTFWKVAGTAEPATYTWSSALNGGTLSGMDGNIRAYAGTNGVAPINGTCSGALAGLGGPCPCGANNETTFVKGEKAVYCCLDEGNAANTTCSPNSLSDTFTANGVFEAYSIGDFDPTSTPAAQSIGLSSNGAATSVGFTILPAPPPLTSFSGRFGPRSLGRFVFQGWDQLVPQLDRENFHFQPRFSPAGISGFKYNSWDKQPPVIDQENPHFVFDFKQAGISGFKYNSWDYSATVFDLENPHFIGRFSQPKLGSFRYTNTADIPLVFIVPETNTSFISQFHPSVLSWFKYNSLDEALPPISETNVHFVGRYGRAVLRAFQYNNWDPTGLNIPPILPPPPPPPALLATATIAAYHRRTIQKNFDISRVVIAPNEFVEDMALEALIQLAITGDIISIRALDKLRDGQVSTYGGSLDWRTLQGLQ
jgi:hypothetical protein